jgi:hypothetical protein
MQIDLLLQGVPDAYEDGNQIYVNNEYVDSILDTIGHHLPTQLDYKSIYLYNKRVMESLKQVRYIHVSLKKLLIHSSRYGVQNDNSYLIVSYITSSGKSVFDPVRIDISQLIQQKVKANKIGILRKCFVGALSFPRSYICFPIKVSDKTVQSWIENSAYLQVELFSHMTKSTNKPTNKPKAKPPLPPTKHHQEDCIQFASSKVNLSGLLYAYHNQDYDGHFRDTEEARHHNIFNELPANSMPDNAKNVHFSAVINADITMNPDTHALIQNRMELLNVGKMNHNNRYTLHKQAAAQPSCGILTLQIQLLPAGNYVNNSQQLVVVHDIAYNKDSAVESQPDSHPLAGTGGLAQKPLLPLFQPANSNMASRALFQDPDEHRQRDPIKEAFYYVPSAKSPSATSHPSSKNTSTGYVGILVYGIHDLYIPAALTTLAAESRSARIVLLYKLSQR